MTKKDPNRTAQIQQHPYSTGYFPDGAKGLVIGTAPPDRFCVNPKTLEEGDIDYFYGSHDNYFWYVIKAVFENDNPCWPRKQSHCKIYQRLYHFAMCDILEKFERNGQGAADNDLNPITYNRRIFNGICGRNSRIENLYFTSVQAFNWFIAAAREFDYRIEPEEINPFPNDYLHCLKVSICGKQLKVFILPSPSGNGARGNVEYAELLRNNPVYKYENYLIDKYREPLLKCLQQGETH